VSSDIRRLNVAACIVVLISLVFVLAVPSNPPASRFALRGETDGYLYASNTGEFQSSVVEDAKNRAEKLFGGSNPAADELVRHLLGSLSACRNVDVLVIFNAGGFGWDSVDDATGWVTIMEGIIDILQGLGHRLMVVDYLRTRFDLGGFVSEGLAFWGFYPLKSQELALRIDFLTYHLPGLEVLIAGESNGSTIVEEAMRILEDNPNVYALQTGPTAIQRCRESENSLVIRHNGLIADSFSQGDIFTIIRSNLEALLGIYQEQPGDILFYIGAPGHYYTWEYDRLRQDITRFLNRSFSS